MTRSRMGPGAAIVLALAPWTWFVVRGADARLDALALAWPVLCVAGVVALVVVAALALDPRSLVVALSWFVAFVVVVVGPWRPLEHTVPQFPVRIAAANVFGDHSDPAVVRGELAAEHPEVVVISEVNDRSDPELGRGYAGHARHGDVAIYTTLPMTATPLPSSIQSQRGLRAVIEGPAGPFVLYALHLQKPGLHASDVEVGFRTYRRIIDRIVVAIRAETLPVVVAGDLNLVDRTGGYRALAEVLDDAMRAGWTGPTSMRIGTRLLLARIDHVFMPAGWCSVDSETFHLSGSDHRGVATTFGPCPTRL